MYFRYVCLCIANCVFTLAAWILAPLLALCVGRDGYLPRWLRWFQTQDAPIDAGWLDGYYGDFLQTRVAPSRLRRYWYRLCWLCRNPAYGFCYWPLGIQYNRSDWVIDVLTYNGTSIAELRAHTKDGKHFCHTTSEGHKYGYKLWWAINPWHSLIIGATLDVSEVLLPQMPPSTGPDNRIPFCFTPGKL